MNATVWSSGPGPGLVARLGRRQGVDQREVLPVVERQQPGMVAGPLGLVVRRRVPSGGSSPSTSSSTAPPRGARAGRQRASRDTTVRRPGGRTRRARRGTASTRRGCAGGKSGSPVAPWSEPSSRSRRSHPGPACRSTRGGATTIRRARHRRGRGRPRTTRSPSALPSGSRCGRRRTRCSRPAGGTATPRPGRERRRGGRRRRFPIGSTSGWTSPAGRLPPRHTWPTRSFVASVSMDMHSIV